MKHLLESSCNRAAFTLIELLTVMAIILVLAGLLINIAGSASYNSAKSRAASEIKAMETGLENYKTDNGSYPSDPYATEKLDPQVHFEPTTTSAPTYTDSSEYLYQCLSGFPVNITGGNNNSTATTTTKAYMTFTASQLHVAANAGSVTVASPTSANMYIIDPFGFSYGYSTVYATTAASNNASSPPITTPITKGYNPTFDLWSTAGYASGGKGLPSGMTASAANYSTLWVTNWH